MHTNDEFHIDTVKVTKVWLNQLIEKSKQRDELLEACKAALITFISDELYQESKTIRETLEKAISRAEGR